MSNINELFKKELKVVNMGLKDFHSDLKKQKVEAVQVDWRPPAMGNKKMASLLNRLKS